MKDPGRLYGRSIGFPPRIDSNGHLTWSEGPQNIRESIKIILLTEAGERLMLSDFGAGLKQFLYAPNTVETRRLLEDRITLTLEQWEPRILLQNVNAEQDPDHPQHAIVTITYQLVTTRQTESVTLQVKLGD